MSILASQLTPPPVNGTHHGAPTPVVPFSVTPDRAPRTDAYVTGLQRQFQLQSDDPIFVHVALVRFLEGLLLEHEERRTAALAQFVAEVKGEGECVTAAGLSLIERVKSSDEAEAGFRKEVSDCLVGMAAYRQDLIETKGLQVALERAVGVLVKRSWLESVLNYILPLMGALLGAVGTVVLLFWLGWISRG